MLVVVENWRAASYVINKKGVFRLYLGVKFTQLEIILKNLHAP